MSSTGWKVFWAIWALGASSATAWFVSSLTTINSEQALGAFIGSFICVTVLGFPSSLLSLTIGFPIGLYAARFAKIEAFMAIPFACALLAGFVQWSWMQRRNVSSPETRAKEFKARP
jgi:hypothetical protein